MRIRILLEYVFKYYQDAYFNTIRMRIQMLLEYFSQGIEHGHFHKKIPQITNVLKKKIFFGKSCFFEKSSTGV